MNNATTTATTASDSTGTESTEARAGTAGTPSVAAGRHARRGGRTASRLLAPLLLLAAVLGLAAPAQAAASYYYEGTYGLSTYYGKSSGWGYLGGDGQFFQVSGYLRDARSDGYCSTLQMRAGTPSGAMTAWFNVGFNCSTATDRYVSGYRSAASGTYFDRLQVRTCQSSSTGAVVGTCSGAVWVGSWRTLSF